MKLLIFLVFLILLIAFFVAVGVMSKKIEAKNDAPLNLVGQIKNLKNKMHPAAYWAIVFFFVSLFFFNIVVRIYNIKG